MTTTGTSRPNPVRVTKAHPCPVCGHDTWCMVGDEQIICMRVTSQRSKILSSGETAYLHSVGEKFSTQIFQAMKQKAEPEYHLDIKKHQKYLNWINKDRRLSDLANTLGVEEGALHLLGCQHAGKHDTYSFPMRDGKENVVGFRLRGSDGSKYAVKGSHQGLFIPQSAPPQGEPVLIVEGPTDCAAAISIGFFAIGRPSCSGGIYQLKEYLIRYRIRSAVIVADLDDPGLNGAMGLSDHMPIPTAILVCPAKDLRQAVSLGMDHLMLKAMVGQLIWRNGNA